MKFAKPNHLHYTPSNGHRHRSSESWHADLRRLIEFRLNRMLDDDVVTFGDGAVTVQRCVSHTFIVRQRGVVERAFRVYREGYAEIVDCVVGLVNAMR